MKFFLSVGVGTLGLLGFMLPFAFAQAASISIQAFSPGTTVLANDRLTFSVVASGFFPETYQLTDSYNGSSITVDDINPSGNVTWVPLTSDVGTHALTITALDQSGNTASAAQTVTVLPPPSVTIGSVSPGQSIMPGTTLTFSISSTGFTNPSYTVGDEFSGSSLIDSDISASGNFSWTPDMSQDGQHTITIYASDSLGHGASVSLPVQVGAGPALLAQVTSSSTAVYPGQVVSMIVSGINFSPTTYSVNDSFANTTIISGYLTSSGAFSWTPQPSDIGTHVLTFEGIVGNYGQSATTSKTITVMSSAGYAAPAASAASPSNISAPLTTTTSPAASSSFTFTAELYSGMQGTAVTQLQTLLAQQGFFSGTPNGYFGPLTVGAVEKFQAAHGLTQLGVVGPATRAALNALQATTPAPTSSSTGDGYVFNNFMGFGEDTTDGSDVLELQKRLAALGFFSGVPSGYFGSVTQSAVEHYQTAQGIPATGYVGSQTRAALNK